MFFNLCSVEVFFKILGSSSSGNAAVLRVHDQTILIDAGLSARSQFQPEEGIAIEELTAVFSHTNTRSFRWNQRAFKVRRLPIFANRDTVQAIRPSCRDDRIGKFLKQESLFLFESFEIHPSAYPRCIRSGRILFQMGKG